MSDSMIILEDDYDRWIFPICYSRRVNDLRCGILTLREKIEKWF